METITKKEEQVLIELKQVPAKMIDEVLDFVKFLKEKHKEQENTTYIASESSLMKDWLTPEEDEAWQDL